MKDKQSIGISQYVRPVTIGCAVGAIVTFALLMLLAVLLTVKDIPAGAAVPLSTVIAGIGAFCGGIAAAKIHKTQGMFIGLATGVAMFVIVLIISMIVSGSPFSLLSLMKFFIMSISSSIGGVLGINTGRKRKII